MAAIIYTQVLSQNAIKRAFDNEYSHCYPSPPLTPAAKIEFWCDSKFCIGTTHLRNNRLCNGTIHLCTGSIDFVYGQYCFVEESTFPTDVVNFLEQPDIFIPVIHVANFAQSFTSRKMFGLEK